MRHDNLVIVYSSSNPSHAEAIRSLLQADGIPCVLGGILRTRAPGVPILDVQVKVAARLAAVARELIHKHDLNLTLSALLSPPSAPTATDGASLAIVSLGSDTMAGAETARGTESGA